MYPFIGWRSTYHLYINHLPRRMTYFKELTHVIIEASKSKVYTLDQQVGDPEKTSCHSSPLKAVLTEVPPPRVYVCIGGWQSFFF